MPSPRPSRTLVSIALLVAALALVGFLPVLAFGFVYDDSWTVVGNTSLDSQLAPLLRSLFLGRGAQAGIPDATRPTMVLSSWIDRRLFGLEPAGYHLHSLLLYALVSGLAVFAVFAVTRRRAAALAGGTLFALAPVHAEVVAAINYREDLLGAVGVLGAFAYILWPRTRPPFIDHVVLVSAVLVLSLFAKESTLAVVPLVGVVLLASRRGALASFRRTAPLLVLSAPLLSWCAWRTWLRLSGRDDVPLASSTPGPVERALRTARYLVRSMFDGLFPFGSSPEYAPEPSPSVLWLGALLAVVLVALALGRRRNTRALGTGIGLALAGGLLSSPLVGPINETADRYAFLSVLGGAVFWGDLFARVPRAAAARARPALLSVGVLSLCPLCWNAIAPFRDEVSLFRSAVEKAPRSARAFTGLSRALRMSGDLPGADRAIEEAIRLDPSLLRARITRLYNTLGKGDVESARRQITEIRALGGERQVGFAQAVHCAALPAAEAAPCSRSRKWGPKPPPRAAGSSSTATGSGGPDRRAPAPM